MLTDFDGREDYGEDRWLGIGTLQHRTVVVVFTEPEDDLTRIISLRKALNHERERYESELRNRLGEGGLAHIAGSIFVIRSASRSNQI